MSGLGTVTLGTFVEFDLGNAVNGNGTFSFAINNSSANVVTYNTKENENAPELIITQGNGNPNQAPVAVNDASATTSGVAVAIDVTNNDSDPDGTIDVGTVSVIDQPGDGAVAVDKGTGVATYTSNAGFVGTDTFTYTVKDDLGATSNTATVSKCGVCGNMSMARMPVSR